MKNSNLPRPPMNERQRAVLGYIRDYMREHQCAPTQTEIKNALKLTSWKWVTMVLWQLQKRGALKVDRNRVRGITLCAPLDAPQWQDLAAGSPRNGQLVLLRSRSESFGDSYAGPVDGWYYSVQVWLLQPGEEHFPHWEQWRAVW